MSGGGGWNTPVSPGWRRPCVTGVAPPLCHPKQKQSNLCMPSVWHEGLYSKLLKYKIGGNFYRLIESLYSNSKCAVKLSKSRTTFFPYSKGVRKGCTLSPLLFNLYINKLTTLFNNTDSDPFILPNGSKLNCLLYMLMI